MQEHLQKISRSSEMVQVMLNLPKNSSFPTRQPTNLKTLLLILLFLSHFFLLLSHQTPLFSFIDGETETQTGTSNSSNP
jgi:hypothetical protein